MRGEVRDGVLQGDLAVVGGGDPNISGRFHDGDSYAVFRPWARALAARGVRGSPATCIWSTACSRSRRSTPTGRATSSPRWYEAPVDALSFSDNCVLVRVRPGRTGGPAGDGRDRCRRSTIFRCDNTRATTGGAAAASLVVSRASDRATRWSSAARSAPQLGPGRDLGHGARSGGLLRRRAARRAGRGGDRGRRGDAAGRRGCPAAVWERVGGPPQRPRCRRSR